MQHRHYAADLDTSSAYGRNSGMKFEDTKSAQMQSVLELNIYKGSLSSGIPEGKA
ncbi:MAG: hypothetical protein K0S36_1388 [Nitrosospira multiformis]|jgi:hypothetical protein|nr:hypothetical protein [Nitrosospira multiformis]